MVELLTVLIQVPIPRLPFVLHVLNCFASQVKSSHAVLMPTNCPLQAKMLGDHLCFMPWLWKNDTLQGNPWRQHGQAEKQFHHCNRKCQSGLWTYYLSHTELVQIDSWSVHENYLNPRWLSETATIKVGLFNLKKVKKSIMDISPQVLQTHRVPGEICKLWMDNIIQRESFNPIMTW